MGVGMGLGCENCGRTGGSFLGENWAAAEAEAESAGWRKVPSGPDDHYWLCGDCWRSERERRRPADRRARADAGP